MTYPASNRVCVAMALMKQEEAPRQEAWFFRLALDHQQAGLTLLDLVRQEKLTHNPTHPMTIPGDSLTQDALGTLHAIWQLSQ